MTDEEIDKMADDFVNAQEFTKVYGTARKAECGAFWKYGFLEGLKVSRPQWHDLREDPTDIPPMKDDTYSVEVWAKDARGNYGTAVFSYACFKDDGKYNHWSGVVPVLWTELPKVEE